MVVNQREWRVRFYGLMRGWCPISLRGNFLWQRCRPSKEDNEYDRKERAKYEKCRARVNARAMAFKRPWPMD